MFQSRVAAKFERRERGFNPQPAEALIRDIGRQPIQIWQPGPGVALSRDQIGEYAPEHRGQVDAMARKTDPVIYIPTVANLTDRWACVQRHIDQANPTRFKRNLGQRRKMPGKLTVHASVAHSNVCGFLEAIVEPVVDRAATEMNSIVARAASVEDLGAIVVERNPLSPSCGRHPEPG